MRVIGIMLVRNEDRFVEWAIRNAIDFCDKFFVCDHESYDETATILERLSKEYGQKLTITRSKDAGESHRMIQSFAGTQTWVFGVDGDEIYDPAGLTRLRHRLESGEFNRWWAIFGNVLNVKHLDFSVASAEGYLAPPCRSMTKLYNFSVIRAWKGKIVERLHGGKIQFHSGFDASLRLNLHEQVTWTDADFRCLHLCFLKRSSRDISSRPRQNIMDRHAKSISKFLMRMRAAFDGKLPEDWKEQKYARGTLITQSIANFLINPL